LVSSSLGQLSNIFQLYLSSPITYGGSKNKIPYKSGQAPFFLLLVLTEETVPCFRSSNLTPSRRTYHINPKHCYLPVLYAAITRGYYYSVNVSYQIAVPLGFARRKSARRLFPHANRPFGSISNNLLCKLFNQDYTICSLYRRDHEWKQQEW